MASIEFALMFPIMMGFFMMSAEMGLIQLRQAMLERAMDIAVRELRLGNPAYRDPEALKAAVCDEVLLISNCLDDIMLEMGPVDPRDFIYSEGSVQCVDRTQALNPVVNYHSGAKNEAMLLRFCVLHDPIFPNTGLGKILPVAAGGGYRLIASTFFVNEPT
ncbi:TadE/TadG family type IV pilus assembly protein [Oceaniglobus roseus]|uniref:TadE/TadG family type IV pilus assembly protein n=1 Tax=Oceaniglobus roseus TaxID=1737570 RepID=UPI0012FFE352|nr:TadE family protein [Kandeliimicrobium roseum]